jgi:hypothetical protein
MLRTACLRLACLEPRLERLSTVCRHFSEVFRNFRYLVKAIRRQRLADASSLARVETNRRGWEIQPFGEEEPRFCGMRSRNLWNRGLARSAAHSCLAEFGHAVEILTRFISNCMSSCHASELLADTLQISWVAGPLPGSILLTLRSRSACTAGAPPR